MGIRIFPLDKQQTQPHGTAVVLPHLCIEAVALPPAATYRLQTTQAATLVLPYIGDILIDETTVEEDTFWLALGQEVTLANPYPDVPIQAYVISLPYTATSPTVGAMLLREMPNQLHTLLADVILIGEFAARQEFEISVPKETALVYVLHGVLEVNDRLLRTQEALLLENIPQLSVETFMPSTACLIIFLD